MREVKIFAYLRDYLGMSVAIELPKILTKKNILSRFLDVYPEYQATFLDCEVAINQKFLGENEEVPLEMALEIALIPPVSGG